MKTVTVFRFFKPMSLKKYLLAAAVCAGLCASATAQGANKVEVSFAFTRQSGFASNQFAVWIEDAQGGYIKTIYATKFTVAGGWRTREQSLPLWVKQSGVSAQPPKTDAVTGPTPATGSLKYTWDITDGNNRPLPAGEYRVIVEASLRNENRVLYTASIRTGGPGGHVTAKAQYFGSSAAERGMIGSVTVKY